MGAYAKRGTELLAKAGVVINGKEPWDLKVKDPEALCVDAFRGGQLAVCEYYMNGGWDSDDLFQMLCRVFRSGIDHKLKGLSDVLLVLKAKLTNPQAVPLSLKVAQKHYDLGNEFYAKWLDPTMTYSSAIWKGVDNLRDAQLQKLEHIGKKLYLEPGMTVLDIGCGWGGLAYFLAKKYGVKVVGLTLSDQQRIKAKERCEGLPVKILVQDYRHHEGVYDRIVSVGMIEHVGVQNYNRYMNFAFRHLRSGGLFLCHGIVGKPGAKSAFLDKYIFPGGEIGATWQIQKAAEEASFKVEDWENFGNGYCRTLMAWHENFTKNWDEIKPLIGPKILEIFGTVERFKRAWILYLVGDAAKFYVRDVSVGQLVLSKDLIGRRYEAIRL